METDRLFDTALGITAPWLIERIDFDPKLKQLDIHINFRRGALPHATVNTRFMTQNPKHGVI